MATDTPRLLLSKPAATDMVSAFQASISSDMDDIDAAFLISRGAWTTSTAYAINDIVTQANIAYRCTAAHTSSGANQPPNVSFWEQWANSAGGTPATSVTNETTLGISPAVGTGTQSAREDHTHGSPSRAAPAVTLGTVAAAGAANTVIATDATIVAFDATVPTTILPDDSAAAGSAAVAARRDHKHAIAADVAGAIQPDDSAAEGVSTSFSRADHRHSNIADIAGASAVGDTAAEGAATSFSRSDHRHSREAFVTNAVVLGTAAANGAATTLIRSDATIAAFDATVPTTIQPDDAAATGSINFAARRDHKHAIVADVPGTIQPDDSASEGSSTSFSRADHRHAIVAATAGASAPADAAAEGSATSFARSDHVHSRESAVRFIRFDMFGGFAPDDGTGEKAARPAKIKSSGAVITNSPTVYVAELLFDKDTDQHWLWQFILPSNYVSGGTLRLKWGALVTTGNVIWKASIAPSTDASTDMDAVQWNTVAAAAATAVPGTSLQTTEITVALTTTGMAANRAAVLFIGRDADAGGDTAAGDAVLLAAVLEYTGSS